MTHRPLHVIHRACMAVMGLFIFQNPHSARDASLPVLWQTDSRNRLRLTITSVSVMAEHLVRAKSQMYTFARPTC